MDSASQTDPPPAKRKRITDFFSVAPQSAALASTSGDDPPAPEVRSLPSLPVATQPEEIPALADVSDFAFVVQRLAAGERICEANKFQLLTNAWMPDSSFKFPVRSCSNGRRSRSFQLAWLSRFNGLLYSPAADGAFCKYFVLFCKGCSWFVEPEGRSFCSCSVCQLYQGH